MDIMFGCSVDLDLSEFFSDVRKLSCTYIDFKECKVIRDAENHIKHLFNIEEDICLVKTKCLSNDVCLFPSSENIRLLQSVNSAAKVKVLSARTVFQPERVTENIDALLPVVTIKEENCDFKIEQPELQFENEEEVVNYYDVANQNGYETEIVSTQTVESVCNKCKDKENNEVARTLYDSSVQTEDVASSESVSLTELNEFLMDDDQEENSNTQNDYLSSDKSKTVNTSLNKDRCFIPDVVDLDGYDSDCEIVDTNKTETLNASKKMIRKNKPLINTDGPIKNILNPKVINLRTNSTFDSPMSIARENKKFRGCKKEKQYQNFSNYTLDGELESQEVNNYDLTKDANSENKVITVHRTETQNHCRKRKKSSQLECVMSADLEYEFYGSDTNQIEIDEQTDKTKCEEDTATIVNNNNGTVLSKQRKQWKEFPLSELILKNCVARKNKKISSNTNFTENNIRNSDVTKTESKKYEECNEECKSGEKGKAKHTKDGLHSLDPLTSLKNKLVEQLNIQLMELREQEINTPETSENSPINYSDGALIIENDLTCTDSEKNHLTTSSLAVTEDFNDSMLPKKRRRKRKHNKKTKTEKLAAAAKMLAPVDFPKPTAAPIIHLPRRSTHKFFSDDDFNDEMDPPDASQHHTTMVDSDLSDEAVQRVNLQNKEEILDQVGTSEIKSVPIVSEHVQPKVMHLSKSPTTMVQLSLNTLINEAKTNKKVLVFECKKMLSKNTEQRLSKVNETLPSVKINDDVSNKSTDLKNPSHFKHEEVRADIGVSDTAKDVNSFSKPVDVSNYPIIENGIEGDVLLFQILRLGLNYEPEISKPIMAKIISINSDNPSSKVVSLQVLRGIEEFEKPEGKFSLEETQQTENEECIELHWNDLIEPRLVYP